MKKTLLALTLSAIVLNPVNALACTYENIKLEDGAVTARWIPCQDENCPDYQKHKRMIENQEVHVVDVAPAKPVDRFATAEIKINDAGEVVEEQKKENAGKVYDKKQHRERDVDAVNTENEIINDETVEVEVQER